MFCVKKNQTRKNCFVSRVAGECSIIVFASLLKTVTKRFKITFHLYNYLHNAYCFSLHKSNIDADLQCLFDFYFRELLEKRMFGSSGFGGGAAAPAFGAAVAPAATNANKVKFIFLYLSIN